MFLLPSFVPFLVYLLSPPLSISGIFPLRLHLQNFFLPIFLRINFTHKRTRFIELKDVAEKRTVYANFEPSRNELRPRSKWILPDSDNIQYITSCAVNCRGRRICHHALPPHISQHIRCSSRNSLIIRG